MWDPSTYLRFGDERSRPFGDLLARIAAHAPVEVVDLGCGPGTLTVHLASRWPTARVHGLDSSPEMISSARGLGSRVQFDVADVADWHPDADVDVVVANAVLQWVPGHRALLRRWVTELSPAAILAFQVPGNFDAPAHRSIHAVAALPRWRDRLLPVLPDNSAVAQPAEYAGDLIDLDCAVDAWETTYVHLLPATGQAHPVLSWVEGTALRPVRALLDDEEWTSFRAELSPRIEAAYPEHRGIVTFPFRRVFVVATTATARPSPREDLDAW